MNETMKAIRVDIIISAIMSLIIGILFIVFPVESESVISMIIGVMILIIAIIMLIGAIVSLSGASASAIILSLLLGALGVWIIVNPLKFALIVYIAIGVMLVVHGIQDFISAFTVKSYGVKTWWLMLGIISIICGIYCIICSFGALNIAAIAAGIMLIVDAIMTVIIAIRASSYQKKMSGNKDVKSKVVD